MYFTESTILPAFLLVLSAVGISSNSGDARYNGCHEILQSSSLAMRCLESALNANFDGQMGLLDLTGNALQLYFCEEGKKRLCGEAEARFFQVPTAAVRRGA